MKFTSAYRWNDITQANLDYQQTQLEWSGVKKIHLQIARGSTKAFLVLDRHRIWNEVDMTDFPVKASTEIRVDLTERSPEDILVFQLSSDGHYLGIIYQVYHARTYRPPKLFVQIIDRRLSKNTTKHWQLSEEVAQDPLGGPLRKAAFSADLSILYDGLWLYDLNSATDDVRPARFAWSNSHGVEMGVLLSPCNRYMCSMLGRTFKIYELCRSTKVVTELCVHGAQFSSEIHQCVGDFHPCLPILVLSGSVEGNVM